MKKELELAISPSTQLEFLIAERDTAGIERALHIDSNSLQNLAMLHSPLFIEACNLIYQQHRESLKEIFQSAFHEENPWLLREIEQFMSEAQLYLHSLAYSFSHSSDNSGFFILHQYPKEYELPQEGTPLNGKIVVSYQSPGIFLQTVSKLRNFNGFINSHSKKSRFFINFTYMDDAYPIVRDFLLKLQEKE